MTSLQLSLLLMMMMIIGSDSNSNSDVHVDGWLFGHWWCWWPNWSFNLQREIEKKNYEQKQNYYIYSISFSIYWSIFWNMCSAIRSSLLDGSIGRSARSATLAVYLFRLSVCLSDLLYFCTIFQLISYKEFHIHMLIFVHIYTYMCL